MKSFPLIHYFFIFSFRSILATAVEITGWGKLRKIGGEDRNRNTFSNHSPSKLQMAVVPLIHQSDCKNETVRSKINVKKSLIILKYLNI